MQNGGFNKCLITLLTAICRSCRPSLRPTLWIVPLPCPLWFAAALQPQTSSDKHRLIEIDEASKITRKAKPTIYTLARKGLIPAYKKGKKLYFYEDELLQWIESGRKQMQAMSLQEQAAEIVHGAKRKPKGGYNF